MKVQKSTNGSEHIYGISAVTNPASRVFSQVLDVLYLTSGINHTHTTQPIETDTIPTIRPQSGAGVARGRGPIFKSATRGFPCEDRPAHVDVGGQARVHRP